MRKAFLGGIEVLDILTVVGIEMKIDIDLALFTSNLILEVRTNTQEA